MEDMIALVEPFPFVPAMCIMFKALNSDGCPSPQSPALDRLVALEAHTSYPILRHHSIISGIAFWFKLLPDLRMASTIAKLLCKVLRAATAS